eukprot:3145207-Ditylum_brightwellii.AAC.1
MTWYERRFPMLLGLEWATTKRLTGILVPKVISDMELFPGNVWVQVERWFLGLAVVCCHGSRICVFLDGFTEEWEDDVSFVATEQKAL